MKHLTLTVPDMWADHHVLAVRDLLTRLPGVTGVAASAMDRTVEVACDQAQLDEAELMARLEAAGYPPGPPQTAETSPANKPAWAAAGVRTTATDPADLAMSGDHRKY